MDSGLRAALGPGMTTTDPRKLTLSVRELLMTDLAATFRALHTGPDLLLLANVWDAGTARLVESLGAAALATTSAGVAWSHGYPDGDTLPAEQLVGTVAAITRVVRVPLTVDIEGGYSDDPAAVGDLVARVIDAGAVGINLEDGTGLPDLLARKIEMAKATAARLGADLFVNARADVYLRGLAAKEARVEEVLTRAARYRDAGTDGLFVPGLRAPDEIRAVASACGRPLNVMAYPGLPDAADLAALGVRRLSAGSGITQAVWGRTAALARAFLEDGRSAPLGDGAMAYADINRLFPPR
jgi:2-methylisocitrate lyase-like PEP mutase family enzyme